MRIDDNYVLGSHGCTCEDRLDRAAGDSNDAEMDATYELREASLAFVRKATARDIQIAKLLNEFDRETKQSPAPPKRAPAPPDSEERMSGNLTQDLGRLNELLASENGEYEAQETFGSLYLLHDYQVDGNRKVGTVECGSFDFLDTPKALYRLLFLCKANRVDFSDMYKSCSLFALTSPDGQFVADFQFYKYELAAYLSAAKGHVEGRQHHILCGVPGSDNGIRAKSPELALWAETLKKCLDRSWMVYGGNDFEV